MSYIDPEESEKNTDSYSADLSDIDALLSALYNVTATSDVCSQIINAQADYQALLSQTSACTAKKHAPVSQHSITLLDEVKSYVMIRYTTLRNNLN